MATIKFFNGDIPPRLKKGEPATNGEALFLGKGRSQYFKFNPELIGNYHYEELTHLFSINVELFEKGNVVDVISTYKVNINDDVFIDYQIDGKSIEEVNIDNIEHSIDLGRIYDTKNIVAVLNFKRDGVIEKSTIRKTIEAVYTTFHGKNTTGNLPTDAEILVGTKSIIKTNDSIKVNIETLANEYGWFAVEQIQTDKTYTLWEISDLNQGTIGKSQFIDKKGTVEVNGRSYDVYMYNYSSDLNDNIILK